MLRGTDDFRQSEMHRDESMKGKKLPGIDQIPTEMIQQEDKYHVLRSMNLHLYLEYERIATISKDYFFLPWRNGLSRPPHYRGFMITLTLTHINCDLTTLGETPVHK
jgi:hypothetical protein